MDRILNEYLEKIDKYLKKVPVTDRVDIINEIKSEMTELVELGGVSPAEVIKRLGDPKELAGAYLGEAIAQSSAFSMKKLMAVIAFYSLAGVGSLFVLPFISVLGVALMFSGVVAPVAGMIKLAGFLTGIEVPWVSFQLGNYVLHPLPAFLMSVITGILLFLAGKGLWNLTIKYIRAVSAGKRKLQEQ